MSNAKGALIMQKSLKKAIENEIKMAIEMADTMNCGYDIFEDKFNKDFAKMYCQIRTTGIVNEDDFHPTDRAIVMYINDNGRVCKLFTEICKFDIDNARKKYLGCIERDGLYHIINRKDTLNFLVKDWYDEYDEDTIQKDYEKFTKKNGYDVAKFINNYEKLQHFIQCWSFDDD